MGMSLALKERYPANRVTLVEIPFQNFHIKPGIAYVFVIAGVLLKLVRMYLYFSARVLVLVCPPRIY